MAFRTRSAFVLFGAALALTALKSWAADEPAKADDVKRPTLWALTDAVLDHHVDPPTRQEMFLGALHAACQASKKPLPVGLSRRLSGLTTQDEFTALLRELAPDAAPDVVLHGLLRRVPGEADWMSDADLKAFTQIADNNYVGTGIQIRFNPEEKLTQVTIPIAGGPWRRAGGKPGDLIVEVDDASMAGLSLAEVVKRLRGSEGTTVSARVRQPGSDVSRVLRMTREVIPFQTVVGRRRTSEESFDFRLAPDLPAAYLNMTSMNVSTLSELRRLDRQFRAEGVQGLILDLRFYGGGELRHAAQVADAFLDGGLMWKVRDNRGNVRDYQSDRDCLFRDLPLVVLVDRETVGGAEWVAAALQDNGRATLVGGDTVGDDFVRGVVPLGPGLGALRLPVGRAERPKPLKTAGFPDGFHGVHPDVVVPLEAKAKENIRRWEQEQQSPEPPVGALPQPPDDPQLARALETLRAAMKAKKAG
jgi:carboxyl-terminal processing protease